VRELTRGIDVVFHLQRHRGRRAGGCAQARGRLVGLGLRTRGGVPHARGPSPVRQRHDLRRRQGLQRGPAAQLQGDVGPRLRRAALLQRLRRAHGRPRALHRGARALDGAHRGRRAAARPRRRPADDGLHLRRRHRPRQHPGRQLRPHRSGLQRRQRRGDEPARARRGAAAGHGLRPLGPPRAVNGVTRRLADTNAARERLGFDAEVGLLEGLTRLVTWWRAERELADSPLAKAS
jgi:hypothetical protein